MKMEMDPKAWNQIAKDAITQVGVPRMKAVADACNEQAGLEDGYRVSIEGAKPLEKHDFRATVITATAEAMIDNAKHNTLIKNFHIAGGD